MNARARPRPAVDPIKAKFRALLKRQVAISIVAFAALLGAYRLFESPNRKLLGVIDAHWALPLGMLAAVLIVVSFFHWRCPACDGYLGRQLWVKTCPKCDAELR
jgi:hypothetical protein